MSARGPIPNLAEAIAGEPIRGSWWGHRKGHDIYRILTAVTASADLIVCRLVNGKQTLLHRRVWPAVVRLADRLPKERLASVRQEHTPRGGTSRWRFRSHAGCPRASSRAPAA